MASFRETVLVCALNVKALNESDQVAAWTFDRSHHKKNEKNKRFRKIAAADDPPHLQLQKQFYHFWKTWWKTTQCEQIWQNFATLAKIYVSGKFLMVYFLFGKMLSLLWQICYIIGLIFIVANGQILKNILTIWSHCYDVTSVGKCLWHTWKSGHIWQQSNAREHSTHRGKDHWSWSYKQNFCLNLH